ncbi:MAG: hypothetical protein J5722_09650 [Oscillospiraceae bacterium]|nr:hypothetical protein [Oscillospiraceae bacterium]
MKKSGKTRLTALMFSAAAIGAGMLMTGCSLARWGGYSVYGPPPVSELDETADSDGLLSGSEEIPTLYGPPGVSETDAEIDLDAMTDADFRSITDEQLIALAQQYDTLEQPAFLAVRPDTNGVHFAVAAQSAETADAASALADALYPGLGVTHVTADEPAERWWLCEAGEALYNYALVWNKAFLDMETQTLHADVTEENMLLLAAMQRPPSGGRIIGAFVTDDGDRLTCNVYDLCYSCGDYGLSDTATLYGFSFSAEKATGKLTGYQSDLYDFSKAVEIPGTFHPDPME